MYVYEDWDLHITAVGRNIGAQITPYDNIREPLPLELILGISQTLQHVPIRWHLTLENMQVWKIAFPNPNNSIFDLEGGETKEKITFIDQAFRHMIFGLELFPEKGFNIRLGYNFRRSAELKILEKRTFAGLSAGFSIRLNKMRLSYTYAKYSSAATSSYFGLIIDLNK